MGISTEEMALRRQATFLEILQTEENYVKDLELVIEYFLEPIRKRDILDKPMISKIFSNWEELLSKVNRPFLQRLRQLDSSDDAGTVFLDMADLFKMYAVYCSNQARIGEVIEQAKKASPELKKLDEKALDDRKTRNQGLRDFLILPMQRVCRYPMLLESLVKYTEGPEKTIEALKDAIFRYKALVAQINEWTRRVENVAKLSQIEKRFRDGKTLGLVQAKRHFVSEGRLKMRLPRSLGLTSNMEVDLQDGAQCFLFDDLLISAAPVDSNDPKSLLLVKFSLDLSRCFNVHVEDIADDTNKAGEEVGFEVVFQISSESDPSKTYQKKFKFKAVSASDRDIWIKRFRELPLLIARRDVANLSQINQHLAGPLSPETERKVFVSSKTREKRAGDSSNASASNSEASSASSAASGAPSSHDAVAMSLRLPNKASGDRGALSARSHLSSSSSASNLHKNSAISSTSSSTSSSSTGEVKGASRRPPARSNLPGAQRIGSPPLQPSAGAKDRVELVFDDDEDDSAEMERGASIHANQSSATSSGGLSSSQGSNLTPGGQFKRPAARRVTGAPPNMPLPSLPFNATRAPADSLHPTSHAAAGMGTIVESPTASPAKDEERSPTPPPPGDSAHPDKPLRTSGLSATSPRLFGGGGGLVQTQQQQTVQGGGNNPTRSNSSGLSSTSKKTSPRGIIQTPSKEDLVEDSATLMVVGERATTFHVASSSSAAASTSSSALSSSNPKVGAAYGRFSGPPSSNNVRFGPGTGPGPLHIPSPTIATSMNAGGGGGSGSTSPPPILMGSMSSVGLFGGALSPLTSPTLSSSPSTFSTLMSQQLARDFETLTLGFIQMVNLMWPNQYYSSAAAAAAAELPLNAISLLEMLKQIEEEKKEQLEKQEFIRKAMSTIRRRLETSGSFSLLNASGSQSSLNGSSNSNPNFMDGGLAAPTEPISASRRGSTSLDSLGDLITTISSGGARSVAAMTSPRLLSHQHHFSTGDAVSHTRVSSALSPPVKSASRHSVSPQTLEAAEQLRTRTAQHSGEIDDEDTVVDDRNTPLKAEPSDTYSQVRRQNSDRRRGSYARSISYAGHTTNVVSNPTPQSSSPRVNVSQSTENKSETTSSESPRPNWTAGAVPPEHQTAPIASSRFQSPPPNHAPPPTPGTTPPYAGNIAAQAGPTASLRSDSPRKRGSSVKVAESSKSVASSKASKRLSDRKEGKKKM